MSVIFVYQLKEERLNFLDRTFSEEYLAEKSNEIERIWEPSDHHLSIEHAAAEIAYTEIIEKCDQVIKKN